MAGKAAVSVRVDDASLNGLLARLAGLSRALAKKALRAGMGEVTKEVLSLARRFVPRRTGLLRKSLGRSVRMLRSGKGVIGKVGPRGHAGKNPDGTRHVPAKIAHLVEYGRREVKPKKKKALAGGPLVGGKRAVVYGKRVRAVAPRPFLRPAWEAVRPRVGAILTKRLQAGIRSYFAKKGVAAAA